MSEDWVIRSATADDIDRIVAFNSKIFRPPVGIWARELLSGVHPTVSVDDFSIVEDRVSGEVISSMCFIRQCWLFEDVLLDVGQVELVGTDERYRGRGLIRAQMGWFAKKLEQNNCMLACVQGVPTLYQRFGFHFAIPLKGGLRLCLDQIPGGKHRPSYSMRPCEEQDLPRLGVLYDKSHEHLAIRSVRDLALWNYQEGQSPESEHAYETYVLERSGQIVGYARLPRHTRLGAVVIRELTITSYDDLIAILVFARERAVAQQYSSVILQLPMSHPALDAVKCWCAEVIPPFAWQVRIVDWLAFFKAIRPMLERRLTQSLMRGYSGGMAILLTDQRISIRFIFQAGKITRVIQEAECHDWQIKLTEPILTMFAMGYRSRAELESWHLEMQSKVEAIYLIDRLFPKLDGFIYEAY